MEMMIKLEHDQLEGELSDDLQSLENLYHLDISYNKLTGNNISFNYF